MYYLESRSKSLGCEDIESSYPKDRPIMLTATVINGKEFLMVIYCGERVWCVNGSSLKCGRSWSANGYTMG